MMPAGSPITMPTAQKIARLDPLQLAPEARVTAIAAGAHFSMALTVGGAVLAFGANEAGQLATGDTEDKWQPTPVPLALAGEAGRTALRVVQLACGASHSVALVSAHGRLQVRTAGANAHGQLGLGDKVPRARFTPIPHLLNVVAVQAGDEHCAAVGSAGELYVWGRGDSGQLGAGDGRAKWKPAALRGFRVVHPDKTLRRNKRSQPFTRPAARGAGAGGSSGPCGAPVM
jgi:E3 ubiquitin-protein ligase HERC3